MEKLKDAVCELVSNSEDATTREHFHELDNMGAEIIDCLDELDKYRAIGTLKELEALKKKATAMPVTSVHTDEYYCPACGSENMCSDYHVVGHKFCPECGQSIIQK